MLNAGLISKKLLKLQSNQTIALYARILHSRFFRRCASIKTWLLNRETLSEKRPPHIVIIGGGAGGLELITRLGNTLGKKQQAMLTLVDKSLTHTWKPLWHELAAGTLNTPEDSVNYIVHGYRHHFSFQLGALKQIDRMHKQVVLSEVTDKNNQQILPERTLHYDKLVIAVGSITHDFNVPGVKEHCFFLDSYTHCDNFYQQFLKHLLQLQNQLIPQLNIVIVGGGATGVELAAELQFTYSQALQYQHKHTEKASKLQITVIESFPRILPMLPEKVSQKTQKALEKQGIKVIVNEQVTQVDSEYLYTKSGLTIPANLRLWTAGIKAPPVLENLGLETNGRNQLLVHQTLQTTLDEDIFAFGDCAHCPQPNTIHTVPPRAQAANQQATLLAQSLKRALLHNKPLLPYVYRDRGSLISISQHYTVGALMGKGIGSLAIEGRLARVAYLYLYRNHQAVLHGWGRVFLLILGALFIRPVRPRLKLH